LKTKGKLWSFNKYKIINQLVNFSVISAHAIVKIKKKTICIVIWVFAAIIGISTVSLLFHVKYVNNSADGCITRVELGMSPYTVLQELGHPDQIGEYTFLNEEQGKGIIFQYDYPYLWDYLTWSRRRVYNFMMEPSFENVRSIGIHFLGDEPKLVEVTNQPRNYSGWLVINLPDTPNESFSPTATSLKDLPEDFFPRKAFSDKIIDDIRARMWCEQGLRSLDETSIYSQRHHDNNKIFRLMRILSGSSSTTIRLEIHPAGTAEASLKQTSRERKLNLSIKRTLTPEILDMFLKCIKEENFWTVSSTVEDPQMISPTIWVVEGLDQGKYHIIASTEEQEGPVKRIGLNFYDLFGIDFESMFRLE